jgi:predicted nucleotidyltransferase
MIDLRSKARQRLLAYYFANPTARLHLRDLAERLNIDPSNLSKELGRLEREGLFQSEVNGRQKYFQLNREYPLFAEVRSIVSKTIGASSLIAQSLKKIEGIEEAYLYGSFASNQQDAASDIDVLVIGTPRDEVLAEAVRKIERQLGREVSYTVLTRKEFDLRRTRKDAFLENVWHNKRVPLIGSNEDVPFPNGLPAPTVAAATFAGSGGGSAGRSMYCGSRLSSSMYGRLIRTTRFPHLR